MKRGGYEEAAKKAEKDGSNTEVTVSFIKLTEVGQAVVGKLLGVMDVQGDKPGNPYWQYVIDTDRGTIKTSFGSAYDREMSTVLHIGNVYRWVYKGQKDISNGHKVNLVETFLIDESEAGELVANFAQREFGTK